MDVPGDYIPRRVTDWHVRQIELGPRLVSCYVSGRWLEFPKEARFYDRMGHMMMIDVMTTTHADEKRYKLCELAVSVEDLRAALNDIELTGEGQDP